MILTRVLTALVFLPLLITPLALGYDKLWCAIVAVFVALSVWELTGMVLGARDSMEESAEEIVSAFLWRPWLVVSVVVLFFALVTLPGGMLESFVVAFALWITAGCFLIMPVSVLSRVERWFLSWTAVIYGCLPWVYVWKLYGSGGGGGEYVIFLITVVMGSDTGGFLGGKYLGRRIWKEAPLAPLISARKTWEGALGALLVSGVVSGAYVFMSQLMPWSLWLVLSVLGSVASMSGDLLASALKRFSGVKDSGRLLPGHGGFIDRGDGFMVAAPFMWWVLSWWPGV